MGHSLVDVVANKCATCREWFACTRTSTFCPSRRKKAAKPGTVPGRRDPG
ncbi:TPA: hypothetical protein JAL43_000317 [Corynebacterium striatum]|nr:hypothetical protein [Corynebacterium striatum]